MRAGGDVQENAIQEEDVRLDVKVLAPGEAEVEEELGEALVFDGNWSVKIFVLLALVRILIQLFHHFLAVGIEMHGLLQRARCLFLPSRFFNILILLLHVLSFHIDLPVFLSGLFGTVQIKVQDETLLNSNIDLHVLVLDKTRVVFLL
mgnify:CR=1 FL=1